MTFLRKNCVPSCRRLFRSRAVKGLVKAMSGLPEPKQAGKTRHPTWRCLLIVLLSLVHGRNWVSDAREFAERHEGKLRKLLNVTAFCRSNVRLKCPAIPIPTWRPSLRPFEPEDTKVSIPWRLFW